MLRLWKRIRGEPSAPPPRRELFAAPAGQFQRLGYLQAVAVIAAKLAKCDGPVKRSEITCFKRLFPLAGDEPSIVGPLFNLARESPAGVEPFIAEIRRMLGEERAERRVLLERLIRVAEADGPLNGAEIGFLGHLAGGLGVEEEWQAYGLRAAAGQEDPYSVLGVACDISDQELRIVWHRLIRRFHPDAVVARGEGEGDHARVAAINAAYRRIRRSRRESQV